MKNKNLPTAPHLFKIKSGALALGLTVISALAAYANDAPQSWVPDVLVMPADMEILTDREIGSSLRMFSISTASDIDTLLTDWEAALRTAGFTITAAQDETLGRVIEFSGPDISNAKIAITPSTLDGQNVIAFDATLP